MAIPPSFRQRRIDMIERRVTKKQLAAEFGVNRKTIYVWTKKMEAEPEPEPHPSELLFQVAWGEPLLVLGPSTPKAGWNKLAEKVREHDRLLARKISDHDRKRLADQRATLLAYLRKWYDRRYPGRNPSDEFLEYYIRSG